MTSDIHPDARFRLLVSWLDEVLPGHDQPVPASSDASFRRYFRVFSEQLPNAAGKGSLIVMDAPPPQEDCRPFVAISEALHQAGVQVPQVLAQDLRQGFLLLTDLGQATMLSAVQERNADATYRRAMQGLLQIQRVPSQALPAYDEALLAREMALFHDWYLGVHRQRLLSAVEQKAWEQACALLVQQAQAQTQVFVHRDYHSRNLMWAEQGPLGVLDFQDAVRGPLSYDLVSLLRDCYVSWPDAQVMSWLEAYREQAVAAGLDVPEHARFIQDFDWMGLQRHLKAVGIFARLNHRDGKAAYLNDIPRTLAYLAQVSARYPQLSILSDLAQESLA